MSTRFACAIILVSAVLGTAGCASTVAPAFPQTVRRIAILPPSWPGKLQPHPDTQEISPSLPSRTTEDLIAEQARRQLAQKGFDVIEPNVVKLATKDRVPTSPRMAAQMLREGNVDAAALYIEIRRWEPMPYDRGMKADGVIVALDATLIDPKTDQVLWQAHRPSRPVPLYGALLTGQANIFAAER